MKPRATREKETGSPTGSGRAFTLIELLVVMAIITLLISILMPSLSKARELAKNVKTRAALKGIGDVLERYRNDNESDRSARETHGYPPSAMGYYRDGSNHDYDDPAVLGTQKMAGAHWLVRHLMGKDLAGYAPRRNVPSGLLHPGTQDEEVAWYGYENGKPAVGRVGPYLDDQSIKIVPTSELPQSPSNPAMISTQEEQVFVDAFGFPILYYVANPAQAGTPRALIASVDYSTPAIYTLRDNALFTGQCFGTSCAIPPWDFGDSDKHPLGDFGSHPGDKPTAGSITANPLTFPYIILDKGLFDASYDSDDPTKTALVPHRMDSFMLFTAGKDGVFGTPDDVTNLK